MSLVPSSLEAKWLWCPRCGHPRAFLSRIFLAQVVGYTRDGLPLEQLVDTNETQVVCIVCPLLRVDE